MKFYLAARYTRRVQLDGYRRFIEAKGGEVTSRWLHGNHQLDDAGTPVYEDGTPQIDSDGHSAEAPARQRQRFATEDVDDVFAADYLIAFTEQPRATNSRGGRHVELGLALGAGKRVIVVGPRENVFTWLPGVRHYDEWGEDIEFFVGGIASHAIDCMFWPESGWDCSQECHRLRFAQAAR